MLRSSTYGGPKTDKFHDSITDNSCIFWIIMIFKNSIPAYVKNNLSKGWQVKHEDIHGYMGGDEIDAAMKKLEKLENKDTKCFSIVCEFEFNWTEDPMKHIDKQVAGMKILDWLYKNPKHKDLLYAYAWNKID